MCIVHIETTNKLCVRNKHHIINQSNSNFKTKKYICVYICLGHCDQNLFRCTKLVSIKLKIDSYIDVSFCKCSYLSVLFFFSRHR